MTRDQAQPGTQVAWTRPDGTHQRGTVLAVPADQSERVLVSWKDRRDRQHTGPLPIDSLRYIRTMTNQPEVRTEWGYEWRMIDGSTCIREALDEEDAREMAENFPDRAVVLCREIRTGPWVVPPRKATR